MPAREAAMEKAILTYIHPRLAEVDYTQNSYKIIGVISGFLLMSFLLSLCYYFCGFNQNLRQLTSVRRWYLSHHLATGIFSVPCVAMGVIHSLPNNPVLVDVVHGRTILSDAFMPWLSGYLVYDFVFLLLLNSNPTLTTSVHHVCGILTSLTITATGKGQGIAVGMLLVEAVLVPAGIHRLLLKCGYEGTWVYKKNLGILLHLFHARNIVEIHMWIRMYRNFNNIMTDLPLVVLVFFTLHLMYLTFYFTPHRCLTFSKMLYGAPEQTESAHSSENGSVTDSSKGDKQE